MLALLASAVNTSVMAIEYGREAATRSWALAMRLVATSSIALVIFLIDRVDLICRRRMRTETAIAYFFTGGGVFLTRLIVSLVSTPSAIASASSSLMTGLPSAVRKSCLK